MPAAATRRVISGHPSRSSSLFFFSVRCLILSGPLAWTGHTICDTELPCHNPNIRNGFLRRRPEKCCHLLHLPGRLALLELLGDRVQQVHHGPKALRSTVPDLPHHDPHGLLLHAGVPPCSCLQGGASSALVSSEGS
ncbi:hypothetical protein FH972_010634 [Carpinus fangiana]|uniref:Uncharacterized protein n=1 Tax=Carpinus fangiana TaxID=176857 RepID=A0A660KQS0_9ROSI|nr:hypothetical protein FH972_010634 [Carpinus fangiana]